MKLQKVEASQERRILTGMIVDTQVLKVIADKWNGERFRSKFANLIGGWCVKHVKRYGVAPAKAIEGIFEAWELKQNDNDLIRTVEKFLSGLSGEYEVEQAAINPTALIDAAGRYFHQVQLSKVNSLLEAHLSNGNLDEAEALLTSHRKIEMGMGAGVDLFQDKEAVGKMFDRRIRDPLVIYPGGLGEFFGHILERDSFVSFCGPQKSGKSWWLMDLAWRAMLQRRKVAFFELGDLSEEQVYERFLVRAAKTPYRSLGNEWPLQVRQPRSMEVEKGSLPDIKYKSLSFDKPLDFLTAWEACEKVMKRKVKSSKSYFRCSCHPNLSISILGIQSILDSWELHGWIPDVVILDYADNLSPVERGEESRDQVNRNWKLMRAMSQSRHCLLVTATQVNAAGFKAKVLDRTNFSEDNRKLSHVTAMIGINVTDEEKEMDVCRLNGIVVRGQRSSPKRCCTVAGCYDLANPSVLSYW